MYLEILKSKKKSHTRGETVTRAKWNHTLHTRLLSSRKLNEPHSHPDPILQSVFHPTIFSDWSKIKSKEVDWLPTGREGVTSDQNENTLILLHHKETMWRRLASSHLKTLATASASAPASARSTQFLLLNRSPSASVFNRYLSAASGPLSRLCLVYCCLLSDLHLHTLTTPFMTSRLCFLCGFCS
jgi:hypothetical protein